MTSQQALARMKADIQLRGYSESTRKIYLRVTERFLEQSKKPIETLDETDVRKFLGNMIVAGGLMPQTVNLYSAGIRFFFAVTLNRKMNYLQIPRMKAPKTLPVVLSKDEVAELIASADNLKHRALLLTVYGSGLRVSELVSLKTADIDSKSMRVFVREGKGRKDRYTLLSDSSLTALREYWKRYRPKSPEGYIFPGMKNIGHITESAVAKVIDDAAVKAKINKNVTPHTLRHCFATHLLEGGLGLLQIKELLGHSSISSTTVYLHLANVTADVVSPADTIVEKIAAKSKEIFEDYPL